MTSYGSCTIHTNNGKKLKADITRLNNSGVWLKVKDGNVTHRTLYRLNRKDRARIARILLTQNVRMREFGHV